MLNKISALNSNKNRAINLVLRRNNSQYHSGINTRFFISNLDISRINNKPYLPRNNEAIPAYEYYFTDFEKYYNQNYNIKKEYDWYFDW